MSSNIVPDNIDGEYPVAGVDNDSQGFRTNFTNTSTNFTFASSEIEDLQAKAILKAPLSGDPSVDNDMQGTQVSAMTLVDYREQVFNHEVKAGSFTVSHLDGPHQLVETGGSIIIGLADGSANALQLSRVKLEMNVTDNSHTVTLPASVVHGIDYIQGAGETIVPGQDETYYDAAGSNGTFFGGDGVGFEYIVGEIITMVTGTTIIVDAIDGSGLVTQFTVTAAGGIEATAGTPYAQSSTTQTGLGFTFTPESANISPAGTITFDEAGYYTFEFTTYDNVEYTIADITRSGAGGSGGASALNALTDVTISSPANGEVLTYNGVQWANSISGALSAYEQAQLPPPDGTGFGGTGEQWVLTLVGPVGSSGADGADGATGSQGIQGDPGIQGAQGIQGVQGEAGPPSEISNVIPASSVGAPGDSNGEMAFDATYLYLCYLNYDPTFVQAQDETNFDGLGDLLNAQDETNYDGAGSNGVFVGGDGVGGTAHVVSDVITLSNGATLTVDAIDGNDDVTQFTVTAVGTPVTLGVILTQSGSSGTGTLFSLTPENANTGNQNGGWTGGDGAGGTAYAVSDVITLVSGATVTVDAIDGNDDVTQFTVDGENTGAISAGVSDPQLTTSATIVTNAQDETNFDGAGSNGVFVGGDGLGGTDHVVSNILTLSNGLTLIVDAVDGNGDVTQFTVTGTGTSVTTGVILTQAATTGTGTLFSLTPESANVAGGTLFELTPESNNLFGGGGVSDIWARTLLDSSAF